MSARRLSVLVDHLPPDSAVMRLADAITTDIAATGHGQQGQRPIRSIAHIPVVAPQAAMRFVNDNDEKFAQDNAS